MRGLRVGRVAHGERQDAVGPLVGVLVEVAVELALLNGPGSGWEPFGGKLVGCFCFQKGYWLFLFSKRVGWTWLVSLGVSFCSFVLLKEF